MFKRIGQFLLKNVLWFIADTVWRLISNKDMQKIALKVVENAAKLDLDGDGKREHAVRELKDKAWQIGRNLGMSQANTLVEMAYQKYREITGA